MFSTDNIEHPVGAVTLGLAGFLAMLLVGTDRAAAQESMEKGAVADTAEVAVVVTDTEIRVAEAVAPGITRFTITNLGTQQHSLALSRKEAKKAEGAMGGEVGMGKKPVQVEQPLEPEATATLIVDLEPGTYQIWCPLAGHEEMATVTVKPEKQKAQS